MVDSYHETTRRIGWTRTNSREAGASMDSLLHHGDMSYTRYRRSKPYSNDSDLTEKLLPIKKALKLWKWKLQTWLGSTTQNSWALLQQTSLFRGSNKQTWKPSSWGYSTNTRLIQYQINSIYRCDSLRSWDNHRRGLASLSFIAQCKPNSWVLRRSLYWKVCMLDWLLWHTYILCSLNSPVWRPCTSTDHLIRHESLARHVFAYRENLYSIFFDFEKSIKYYL